MGSLKKELKLFKSNRHLFILTVPAILFLLLFNYLPMFGAIIAFKDYNNSKGIFGSKWVGFDNFKFFFTSKSALKITINTISYNLVFIILGTIIAIIFALMLNELSKRSVKIFQTVFLMPYFLSFVIVSYVLYAFLNPELGVINKLIMSMGGEEVLWYTEPKYWPFILVIAYLWKSVGYSCIIYYTGLIGIDTSYYEAADIDGASKLQQITNISLPLLRPLIILLVLLSLGSIFKSDFGLFYFLPKNSGVLYDTTDVIDTYVYRSLTRGGDIGMSAASGLYQSVVGFVVVITANKLVSMIDKDSSIF